MTQHAHLQWGHVNEDVEEVLMLSLSSTALILQWGHVNEDVEEDTSS